MTGLAASIRVLFWKHWRMKQREGMLNKKRPTTRGTWLFPPLLTDIVLPLVAVLYLIQVFCGFNVEIGESLKQGTRATGVSRALMYTPLTSSSVASLMTAFPLALATSGFRLVTLDRPENHDFLAYLDREYPGVDTLGFKPLSTYATVLPFNASMPAREIDAMLEEYPKDTGENVYAAIDLRRSSPDPLTPIEARLFFNEDDASKSPSYGSSDQVKHYFALKVHDGHADRYLRFAGVLALQAELNTFLRGKVVESKADDGEDDRIALSPSRACRAMEMVLDDASLQWKDLASTSPLGQSVDSCVKAVSKGQATLLTLRFLARLVKQVETGDELKDMRVGLVPKRPTKTVSGPLEMNIVFYMAYLFLWPYNRLIRDIVAEKEAQLKEYLLIMGLQPMALLISWFLLYFVASVLVVVIAVFMLSGSMFAATSASAWHFSLLLLVFATSMLLFAIAITPIFNQARTAATAAPFLYMVLGAAPFLRSFIGEDEVDETALHYVVWIMEQISSPVVFMEALHDIIALDGPTAQIRPIEWTTVSSPSLKMLMQCCGYLVLGWYLENVFPRTFGVQQKWNFVFRPSYWFPAWRARATSRAGNNSDEETIRLTTSSAETDDTLREMAFADYVDQFQPILLVNSIAKRYPNGKLAVQNVSFGVKKGEIFGLLGPNGAGKSTTMAMLCGMLSPTEGDAFVGSTSVASDPLAIRKNLSVCFQQNILYDNLTVWEHLKLIYELKSSIGVKAVDEEMWMHKLQQFGLAEKADALAVTLSGGQKRKLSLVLALMDTSRVVLLDEPTAGMDLKARVDTWDALKKAVNHRAVILTTHSMQEAQALCENIGIVADSKLKCCGSSLFLRERFGVGYKLTVVHTEAESQPSSGRWRAGDLIIGIRNHAPKAVVVSDNKWETRIQLNEDDPAKFLPIFDDLEKMKRDNRIMRYAVAATDLEDVFVRVTEGDDTYHHVNEDGSQSIDTEMKPQISAKNAKSSELSVQSQSDRLTDNQAMSSQISALVLKRWRMAIRDKRALGGQYLWPIIVFVILLATSSRMNADSNLSETITSLPDSASHASVYVGSRPDMSAATKEILTNVGASQHSRVVYEEVESAAEMLDSLLYQDPEKQYFGAAFVRNVTWTTSELPLLEYSVYYNESISKSLPVTLEWISQAYCKTLRVKSRKEPNDCELMVTRSAFPSQTSPFAITSSSRQVVQKKLELESTEKQSTGKRMSLAFYVLLVLNMITSNYITAVVKEREIGLKRLQYIHMASQRTSFVYWLSHLVFDYSGFTIAITLLITAIQVFSFSWSFDLMVPFTVSSLLFGVSVIAFTYVFSLVFKSHSSAQSVATYVWLFQLLGTAVVFTLGMVPGACVQANTAASFLEVLPLFAYGRSILNLATMEWAPMRAQCLAMATMSPQQQARFENAKPFELLDLMKLEFESDKPPSPWDWSVAGKPIVYMAVSAIVYMILLLVLDMLQMYPTVLPSRVRTFMRRAESTEYEAVGNRTPGSLSANVIEVGHLSKIYNARKAPTNSTSSRVGGAAENMNAGHDEQPVLNQSGQVVAVDDISFTVERNDCVALLGINGSGKSTTFEVLTSGITPTSGKAFINGIDVTVNPQLASRQYGYCPQTNIFFGEMTVHEHLQLFHRLRRRDRSALDHERPIIDGLLTKLDLIPVRNTAASNLSGGNKRRLMLALSLLSDDVSLLLMDEPSAGVDVVARRLMWRVLYEKRHDNRDVSCLFTTHSMEEAESVCANAVVLNKGKLVWSGSIPELKQHAARGISISIRLETSAIWDSERVRYYTEKVRAMLATRSTAQDALGQGKIPADELENAWRLCRECYPHSRKDSSPGSPRPPLPQGTRWIASLLARVEQEHGSTNADLSKEGLAITEFVKEWLIQETFATIEVQLFDEKVTACSGEEVKSVELQNANGSGSNTTAVYETNCNDQFAVADAFRIMEGNKSTFSIARYSISELSLERVFEQFT